MTTKHLTVLAAVLLFATDAAAFQVNGLYYNITGENTVEVTKTPRASAPPKGDITIPTTVEYDGQTYYVTAVCDYAFNYNDDITSVSISEGITSIGKTMRSTIAML